MGGFGRETRDAMEARTEHLIQEGLARRQGQRIILQRDLLNTLRRRELDEVGARVSADTGLPHVKAASGEQVTGTYRQRLTLASGRYPHVTVELPALVAGTDPRSPAAVLDRLLATIVADQAGPETRAVLAAQLTDPQITRLSTDDRGSANTDVAKLAALVIGSPEFQRR